MSDKNYVVLAGNPSGELYLTDPRVSPDPQLLRASGNDELVELDLGDVCPPAGYADALKLSGVVNVKLHVGELQGGEEDCVDINHSSDVTVVIDRAVPRGRYVSTIKGGTVNAMLVVKKQVGHGRYTDYDLGNWADGFTRRTTGTHLSAMVHDGSAARVRVLHAHRPTLDPAGKWEVSAWLKGCFQAVYEVLKRLHLA